MQYVVEKRVAVNCNALTIEWATLCGSDDDDVHTLLTAHFPEM